MAAEIKCIILFKPYTGQMVYFVNIKFLHSSNVAALRIAHGAERIALPGQKFPFVKRYALCSMPLAAYAMRPAPCI